MKITTIAYGFTFNRGNYQSERIDMTAALDAGEDEQIALLRLKGAVLGIGGDVDGARLARIQADLAEGVYVSLEE